MCTRFCILLLLATAVSSCKKETGTSGGLVFLAAKDGVWTIDKRPFIANSSLFAFGPRFLVSRDSLSIVLGTDTASGTYTLLNKTEYETRAQSYEQHAPATRELYLQFTWGLAPYEYVQATAPLARVFDTLSGKYLEVKGCLLQKAADPATRLRLDLHVRLDGPADATFPNAYTVDAQYTHLLRPVYPSAIRWYAWLWKVDSDHSLILTLHDRPAPGRFFQISGVPISLTDSSTATLNWMDGPNQYTSASASGLRFSTDPTPEGYLVTIPPLWLTGGRGDSVYITPNRLLIRTRP